MKISVLSLIHGDLFTTQVLLEMKAQCHDNFQRAMENEESRTRCHYSVRPNIQ